MHTPTLKRFALVVASLIFAALACARAEVPIVPASANISTPLPAADTATLAASETPAPTLEPTATAEVLPTETALSEITATPETVSGGDTPTAEALPNTDTPTVEVIPPTDTPVPTLPPVSGGSIPANATFIQNFDITSEAGLLVGRPQDMLDGSVTTWASLRAGNAYWIFDLGTAQNVAGVRLHARSDGGEATTLTGIEVSADGVNWTPAYAGSGDCGEPNCDTLPPDAEVDIAFGPAAVRYLRLRAGPAPARFAFGEVWVAVVP